MFRKQCFCEYALCGSIQFLSIEKAQQLDQLFIAVQKLLICSGLIKFIFVQYLQWCFIQYVCNSRFKLHVRKKKKKKKENKKNKKKRRKQNKKRKKKKRRKKKEKEKKRDNQKK
eukprot:TRINITY_DN5592_c0_g2_i1.p3 TRINITY_DN5592_c0_g2~~TRINITY_DN5592_c0_g2_i1.p3  ORF type:complete len:114 (+),score=15.34 TRINITY_DN5592_c0_g2_i1:418-759(+)